MRSTGTPIGLATGYRILQALAEAGEVDVVRTGDGEALYRLCRSTEHHHHLLCRRCGRAVELDARWWSAGRPRWPRSTASPPSTTSSRSSAPAPTAPLRGELADRPARRPRPPQPGGPVHRAARRVV